MLDTKTKWLLQQLLEAVVVEVNEETVTARTMLTGIPDTYTDSEIEEVYSKFSEWISECLEPYHGWRDRKDKDFKSTKTEVKKCLESKFQSAVTSLKEEL